MKSIQGGHKRKGLMVYLAAFFLVLSVVSYLFPFLGEKLPDGNAVYFSSIKLLFGGDDSITKDGYVYSFHYNLNLPILIVLFVELVAVMAALAGRNAPRHIGICATLSLMAMIGLCFSRKFASIVNESLIHDSLLLGPGYFLAIAMAALGSIIAFVELGFCIAYWKKKTAF